METILAIKLKDAVITLSDRNSGRSIVKMKEDEDKSIVLGGSKLLLACGEAGDRIQFSEYIQKNLNLYNLRNGYELSTLATAHYIRGELATALRQSPYQVNLILAGHDNIDGPSVHFIDYLGSLQTMNFAVHGYAGYFLLSLLDKYYREDQTVEDGIKLLRMCVTELKTRFIVNTRYLAKVVDANGIRIVELDLDSAAK
eukprot:Phypoly_transcript_17311.p1 GENE.Phypoly_transcript_17311~~Phypoly_transcript_17311.p1  ORF type:complete len:199 (-),score=22.39 Phypoly_transcript_17311:110-706(-)